MKIKKKTRRQINKTTKSLRKALKRASKSPYGIAGGVLTLGGLAAAVAMDPEVRERTRVLAGAARDFVQRLGKGISTPAAHEPALLEHTH